MKDISYWIKRIEEDIYEPDKIFIDIGHLRKLLNTAHNSSYAKCEKVATLLDSQVHNMRREDILETLKKHFA